MPANWARAVAPVAACDVKQRDVVEFRPADRLKSDSRGLLGTGRAILRFTLGREFN
jgi:hypothetical protein